MTPDDKLTPEKIPQVKPDCVHYTGYKPCGRAEDCDGCPDYKPPGPRVLIIKLGALGDVLRTTPLLTGLKAQLPGCEVTWLTSPAAEGLLIGNGLIDRLWVTGAESLARLGVEEFDRVICLDKEPLAATAASLARSEDKYGFGLSPQGKLIVFNRAAVENLRLGVSDELKFRQNLKTYQQLIFEAAELDFSPDYDYLFSPDPADLAWAEEQVGRWRAGRPGPVIGFNLGGGEVFACKRYKLHHFLALRKMIEAKWGGDALVLALGGSAEADRLDRLTGADGPAIVNTGPDNSLSRFSALLGRCDVVVTGDSLALHLALAVKTPVVLLIGSTTPREIELYGRGRMLVSDMDCAPCYRRQCPQPVDCMENFPPEQVMDLLAEVVEN